MQNTNIFFLPSTHLNTLIRAPKLFQQTPSHKNSVQSGCNADLRYQESTLKYIIVCKYNKQIKMYTTFKIQYTTIDFLSMHITPNYSTHHQTKKGGRSLKYNVKIYYNYS